jgi:hypothetical protein
MRGACEGGGEGEVCGCGELKGKWHGGDGQPRLSVETARGC